ncbi:MAG: PhzF family phenazine biosynthesis protein [Anaerolineae bacterium]|nr:PhzF family phenazine biosynthesis protein [Anaerolineae bacterium]
MSQTTERIQKLHKLPFTHVDVFSRTPLSGNGLIVFPSARGLSSSQMQRLTQEMRQFESIFLTRKRGQTYGARIFTMQEEVAFAGHPSLGAAATLHHHKENAATREEWVLDLPAKSVQIITEKRDYGYEATMNQGEPHFGKPISTRRANTFVKAFNLSADDLADLPLQVVSTGLPYLILPIKRGIERARIVQPTVGKLLQRVGANYAYLLDVERREARSWENDGSLEDVATGSAAGPAGAYLVRHGLADVEDTLTIRQGRFLGRESELRVRIYGTTTLLTSVHVAGDVVIIAEGKLL